MREIELLSPAKNCEIGISAILAGADAVYIGGELYGARKQAANSIEDIKRLCDFAHVYNAKVYLALNTILTDNEIRDARELAYSSYEAGIDGLIIQDLGLLKLSLPPIPLHASTQTHIDSLEKAKFLESLGFETLVLARELTLDEIKYISQNVSCRIEAFVHGAVCVCYSGQCYLSYAIGGRSGNRGECAQPCRMNYDFVDSNGKHITKNSHLLSLKDMNRSENIKEMIDAGVSSLKIEGRLKDEDYIKNITAYYRQKIDEAIKDTKDLKRSSYGNSKILFHPNPNKTFNRGYSKYFLHGIDESVNSFSSPKSKGEFLGIVSRVFSGGFFLKNSTLSNGDGLYIENPDGSALGTSAELVSEDRIRCGKFCPQIFEGAKVWRNKDLNFEKSLTQKISRNSKIDILFYLRDSSYILRLTHIESGIFIEEILEAEKFEEAKNKDSSIKLLNENFSKFGNTPFDVNEIIIKQEKIPFLRSSEINSLRRTACEKLIIEIQKNHNRKKVLDAKKIITPNNIPSDYRANVLNDFAKEFYLEKGINISEYALEKGSIATGKVVMKTKHCILRELNMCKKNNKLPKDFEEPFFLKTEKNILRIHFDCSRCGMDIFYGR